jgi:hypothetical protein
MNWTSQGVSTSLLAYSLLIAFSFGPTIEAAAQSAGTFTPIGNMTASRGGHTATFLPNGKVLITGGRSDGLTSAELFDPVASTFVATGEMIAPRRGHTATLLTNGRVLITGGFLSNTNTALASAELYDPSTGTFTATGSMLTAMAGHTATLLYDGRVLVVGDNDTPELYDPAMGTFTVTEARRINYHLQATRRILPTEDLFKESYDTHHPDATTFVWGGQRRGKPRHFPASGICRHSRSASF